MPVKCIRFVCRHNVVDCEPDLEQRQGRIVHYGCGLGLLLSDCVYCFAQVITTGISADCLASLAGMQTSPPWLAGQMLAVGTGCVLVLGLV